MADLNTNTNELLEVLNIAKSNVVDTSGLDTDDKTIVGAINEVNKKTDDLTVLIEDVFSPTITDLTGKTYILNDTLDLFNKEATFNIDFVSNGKSYTSLKIEYETDGEEEAYRLSYGMDWAYYASINYEGTVLSDQWRDEGYKTITFTSGADAINTDLINLLNTLGKVQYTLATVDKVKSIDTWAGEVQDLDTDDGIYWTDGFALMDENGKTIANGEIYHRVPIMQGNNVQFEPVEDGQYVKINVEVDTSNLQPKTDNTLTTTSHEIVGAINEVNRKIGTSIDKIATVNKIDTFDVGYSEDTTIVDHGIKAAYNATIYDADDGNMADVTFNIGLPIVAGNNVEFEVDEENEVVKINATGGGSPAKSIYVDSNSQSIWGTSDSGILWQDNMNLYADTAGGELLEALPVLHNIPIVPGNNIEFNIDNGNVVKIDVPAIGDIQTALDSIIAQTESIIGGNSQ